MSSRVARWSSYRGHDNNNNFIMINLRNLLTTLVEAAESFEKHEDFGLEGC